MQSSFKTHPVGLWKRAKRNEQDTKKHLSLRLSFTSFSLFYFCKMQNQAGGRTCLSILVKLHSTNARVGQVVVVKICRLLSSCDQVVNPVEMCFLQLASCCAASKKQFTLHQMLFTYILHLFANKSEQDSCPTHTDLEFFRQLSVPHGVRLPCYAMAERRLMKNRWSLMNVPRRIGFAANAD